MLRSTPAHSHIRMWLNTNTNEFRGESDELNVCKLCYPTVRTHICRDTAV